MTTKEAKAVARRLAKVEKWSPDDQEAWKKASRTLAEKAEICPSCYINDGKITRLMERCRSLCPSCRR